MTLSLAFDFLNRRACPTVHVLVVLAALVWWAIWAPVLTSYDSLDQYQQAQTGQFSDAQPLLLSVSLHVLLRLFGDPAGLHVLGATQCVLGLLGVLHLSVAVQSHALGERTDARAHWPWWTALAVTAVLLNPYSPLGVYLVTFWKDVWLLVGGVWIGVIVLRLATRFCEASLSPTATIARLAGLAMLMGLLLLTRHNAILLAPILGALLATLTLAASGLRGRRAVVLGLLAAVAPVLAMKAADTAIRGSVPVQHVALESHPLGLELIHVLAEEPDAAADLPHTAGALPPDWQQRVTLGWVDSCWPVCRPGYFEHPEPIRAEYWHAVRTRPMAILRAKWTGFVFHLVPNRCEPFVPENVAMPMNGRIQFAPQSEWSARWRQKWSARLRRSFDTWRGWLFCRHLPWMAVAAGLLGLAAVRAARARTAAAAVAALLTALSMGYYAAYLAASTAGDFRYMYPADVWTQIAVLSLLASSLASAVAARGGAPAPCGGGSP